MRRDTPANSICTGGIIARTIAAKIGSPGVLAVGVGLRILISISWAFVPNVPLTECQTAANQDDSFNSETSPDVEKNPRQEIIEASSST